jgi:hypothetical protein
MECGASYLIMILYSRTAMISSWSVSMESGEDSTHGYLLILLIIPRSKF